MLFKNPFLHKDGFLFVFILSNHLTQQIVCIHMFQRDKDERANKFKPVYDSPGGKTGTYTYIEGN